MYSLYWDLNGVCCSTYVIVKEWVDLGWVFCVHKARVTSAIQF